MRCVTWFVLLLLATGCATVPTTPDPQGPPPIDVSIEMEIQPASGDAELASLVPGGGGQFLLNPDGVLQYGRLGARNADWLPTATRRLSRGQLADVWLLVRQLGYADPADGQVTVAAPTEPGACRLSLTGWDTRWSFASRIGSEYSGDAAMLQLVERLASMLSLEPDRPARTIIPRRYDFGPDPYARYR